MRPKQITLLFFFSGVVLSGIIMAKKWLQNKINPNSLHEAMFYHQLDNGWVQCDLCPNRCRLKPGQRGICGVRMNIKGKLYSLVYGKPVVIHLDPVEKKPFYHFLPGAKTFSLATAGCNLDCQYCQNWEIAHRAPEELKAIPLSPQEVIKAAQREGAQIIAFTYNEPVVWYEYMLDIARLAHQAGLKTVLVTSGYINPEPLKQLLPYLDGVKVDLKAINSETYQRLIKGHLEPVLEAIKLIAASGTWLELVHLIVPGWTDDLGEIKKMCAWIKTNLGDEVPLHFLRFWPRYKLLNLPPTPESLLTQARQICQQEVGLKFVYTGNINDPQGSATYCPTNNQVVIQRQGFFVTKNLVDAYGKAPNCPVKIPGVWQ